jgi:hypothetical protein
MGSINLHWGGCMVGIKQTIKKQGYCCVQGCKEKIILSKKKKLLKECFCTRHKEILKNMGAY